LSQTLILAVVAWQLWPCSQPKVASYGAETIGAIILKEVEVLSAMSNAAAGLDELEYLARGSLVREEPGQSHDTRVTGVERAPKRQFVFRKNADYERLIVACTKKLQQHPDDFRALMIRGNSYLQKGEPRVHTACPRTGPSCQGVPFAPPRLSHWLMNTRRAVHPLPICILRRRPPSLSP
jgi:hypothetical protein